MASKPFNDVKCSYNLLEISISAEPPPVIKDLVLIKDLITHNASWSDL